jgi:hypothetical protein
MPIIPATQEAELGESQSKVILDMVQDIVEGFPSKHGLDFNP